MHNWVAQRPDFKSALRVVEIVLNTQCYQYLWLTMLFHAKKSKETLKKTKTQSNDSAFFFKCTFMWRSKFAFLAKLFPQGSQEFWVDFETFSNFSREWCFLCFFIFEASVLSYWQISHWMLSGSFCFLMWLLNWLAPFPFSPHNLHWKGLSLCILYWCSPNYSWLGNLFEHMLQTQSILMLEIILHNWL